MSVKVPNDPIKNHHSPVFYLEGWCDKDSKVTIFSRPYKDVEARGRHPNAIGFERELYTIMGAAEKQKRALERDYLAPKVDTPAAPVLVKLRAGKLRELTEEDRRNWARFLAAGHGRSPKMLNKVAEEWARIAREIMAADGVEDAYQAAKEEGDPSTFFEWGQRRHPSLVNDSVRRELEGFIENQTYRNIFLGRRWSVLDLARSKHELLTSDAPFLLTARLEARHSVLMYPIGPTLLFVASEDGLVGANVRTWSPTRIARHINLGVVGNAWREVYGRGEGQKVFVENHLRRTVD